METKLKEASQATEGELGGYSKWFWCKRILEDWALPVMMQNGVDTAASGQISFTGPHCTQEYLLCVWAADNPFFLDSCAIWKLAGKRSKQSFSWQPTPQSQGSPSRCNQDLNWSLLIPFHEHWTTGQVQWLNMQHQGHYVGFLTHWATIELRSSYF